MTPLNKSITMSLEGFNLALWDKTGIPSNQIDVLSFLHQAIKDGTPIFLTDEKTKKKYRLLETGLVEI